MAKEKNVERNIASGIPGLDPLLGGGFFPNSLVMVSGNTGAGKSLLCLQFLYHGATQLNEPGVLISLEQKAGDILRMGKQFGWDLDSLISRKKLWIESPPIYEFKQLEKGIFDSIKKTGAKRLVIDSYTIASTYFLKPEENRRALMLLSRKLQNLDCVSLVVSDIPEGARTFSISGFEEFVVDGIIHLALVSDAKRNMFVRSALVRKMRYRNHSLKRVPLKITKQGVVVYPQDELF